jgi:signal transduction histidine kinase
MSDDVIRYRALSMELASVQKRLEEFIDVLCHGGSRIFHEISPKFLMTSSWRHVIIYIVVELRNPLNGIYGSTQLLNEVYENLNKEFSDMVIPMEKTTKIDAGVSFHHFFLYLFLWKSWFNTTQKQENGVVSRYIISLSLFLRQSRRVVFMRQIRMHKCSCGTAKTKEYRDTFTLIQL